METVSLQLPALLAALWWPFCRCLAALSFAPIFGDNLLPVTVRVLLSLALAIVLLPLAQDHPPIDPFSLHGILATGQEALIGLVIGLAFQMVIAALMMLGFLVSSQMGLAMAVMNDPLNGSSSDVVSSLIYMLTILVFFAVDGHLVVIGVLAKSFHAWPVGHGFALLALNRFALNFAWVFSAALLLALPILFSTLVVQVGFGLLNRVAPALNLFSLGFSIVTMFGLMMLGWMLRTLPAHYVEMSSRVLDMLHRDLGV